MHTGPRKRGQWFHKRRSQNCREYLGFLSRAVGWQRPATGSGALTQQYCKELLLVQVLWEELAISPLYFGQVEEGNTAPPISWKWVKVKSLSCVRLFETLWTVAYQASPSMGFSRQEYWSGLPFPSPGDLPNPGIEPWSPALQADPLTSKPPGKLS